METAPEVVEFLKNYQTSTEITSELLAYMQDNDLDIDKTVNWFFNEYEELWTSWVPEDIEIKIREALDSKDDRFLVGVNQFPKGLRIELGVYVEKFVSWLTESFQGFF